VERINRNSKLPYYQQLYEILRANISRGEWKPGDLIPGESELIKLYAVSRITVRQVLEMLVREGLIYRERGRGTFVAHPTVDEGLGRIVSFTEDMRRRGFKPASRILVANTGPAAPEIAARLEIEPGEELACIERLRLADDEPMSLEKSYLVHRYCPGVTSVYNPASDSLRELLEERYGVHIARAKQVIRAVAAAPGLARLLSIPARSPLLHVERISYSQQGVPIEFLTIQYRADRYSLHNELHD
jgi:GntR family transcriptional regulator